MNKCMITLLLACCFLQSYAANPPAKKTVGRYERFQENTVVLPTPFAKPFIIDQSDIELLAGKKIHHVDLVYTQYRSSPDFDQKGLNDRRIAELKKLLPQINKDQPTWALVEQTDAKDRETANGYFHGFVIHYSEPQDATELRTFLSDKAKPMTSYTVSTEKGGTFSYASGTTITVPANAVTYADGTPVKGNFELQYREFRNPAEIVLSGIPMIYQQKGTPYNFSSVGMYELRGNQNGKELNLQKPITVDFNCTKVVDDADFYQLDDKSGQWEQLKPIVFDGQQADAGNQPKEQPDIAFQPFLEQIAAGPVKIWQGDKPLAFDSKNGIYLEYESEGDDYVVRMSADAWKRFHEKSKDSANLRKAIHSSDNAGRTLKINKSNYPRIEVIVFGNRIGGLALAANQPKNFGTLLADGANEAHTYPTIVKGLNSEEFGVYNADQIYRIDNPLAISPDYIDAATGERIRYLHVACVLDLNYNGSFSFQPNNLMCNPKGRNVILLFTHDRKTYLLDEQAFAKTDKTKLRVNFAMTDVTDRVKTTEDLKQLLQL